MSWGVFVSFSLALTEERWKELSAQTVAAAGLGTDFQAWPSADYAWYFAPKKFGEKPVAELLDPAVWEDEEFEDVGLTVEREGGKVDFALFAFVDRAAHEIHEVGALARVLVGAHRVGATGSLVISSDGSAPTGVGWRCTVKDGVLSTTPLSSDETTELREAGFARLGIEEE